MAAAVPKDFRRVIVAAAVGNVIEWYDFYIFGSLAAILAVKFFDKTHPVAALLSTIALFTAGFLIRPLGAFLFGWLGDRVGRKYTFLITLTGMGIGTGVIGLIPSYQSIGLSAAILLFSLRMIQGLCLGGEYGGAITYVAEHVSDERRGYYTGWLQTSPTLGIVLSLLVIIVVRTYFGEAAFNDWAWRVPFLFSFLLVFITLYMRLSFEESPIYEEIKAKGGTSKNPWKEAFLSANFKFVVIATIIVLGGFFLAAVTYYPLYLWLGSVTHPGSINYPIAILIVAILVAYVGMVYGPIGAFLAEYFPGWIRYTAVSMPYMIGNGWGGGLVPFITTAAYTATGSVAYALIYPIAVPAICLVLGLYLMPETKQMKIWEAEPAKA